MTFGAVIMGDILAVAGPITSVSCVMIGVMAGELEIAGFCLGPWQTNCYVVWQRGGRRCWIVDASFDPESMIEMIEERGLEPELLVLTHAHLDHIAGVRAVRERWPAVLIVMHEAESEFLSDPVLNLSAMMPAPITAPPADRFIKHGDVLEMGDAKFEVRHTPGHSPGGICLYNAQNAVAINGDTLFEDSVGRSDFPTSDGNQLMRSIREQLLTLPDETRVLPGHGPATTIGRERRENPFLIDEG